jgi:hypothetical protein
MDFLYSILSGVLVGAVLLLLLSIVYVSWKNGISPMPASAVVRRAVAAEINRFSDRGLIVDAGSGWGTLALFVARHCSGWRIIGIENSRIPFWISRLLSRFNFSTNVSFIKGDLYTYPYESVDLVVCYLYPGAMKRLNTIFREKMTPGARVISVCFALPGWQSERVITCGDLYRTKVYVYTVMVPLSASRTLLAISNGAPVERL